MSLGSWIAKGIVKEVVKNEVISKTADVVVRALDGIENGINKKAKDKRSNFISSTPGTEHYFIPYTSNFDRYFSNGIVDVNNNTKFYPRNSGILHQNEIRIYDSNDRCLGDIQHKLHLLKSDEYIVTAEGNQLFSLLASDYSTIHVLSTSLKLVLKTKGMKSDIIYGGICCGSIEWNSFAGYMISVSDPERRDIVVLVAEVVGYNAAIMDRRARNTTGE